MIELNENTYIVGVWFSSDKDGNNWLCFVTRDDGPVKINYQPYTTIIKKGTFTVTYRFRYAKDDKIFNSDDEKTFFKFSTEKFYSEEEIIDLIKDIQNTSAAIACDFHDHFLIQGGLDKFLEIAKTKDWMHLQEHTIQ